MYRTTHIYISKTSYLYNYFDNVCHNVTKLYNRANFLVRQYSTAMRSIEEGRNLFDTQKEVCELVQSLLKDHKYFPQGKWMSYNAIDFLLKNTDDPTYYGVPSQVNQQTLRKLDKDYTSFFNALKVYNESPELFKARPKLPKYRKEAKTAVFTNQICEIRENELGLPVIKFPSTKETLRIKVSVIPKGGVLKEIRVSPVNGKYKLGIVFDIPQKGIKILEDDKILKNLRKRKTIDDIRVLSIDPGVDNLCTITNNFGERPVIVKGTNLKSINQFYNKQKAQYQSISKTCNDRYSTKRMSLITNKRNNRVYDLLHKTSRMITDYASDNNVNVVIMGHNVFQKQEISIGHVNNQNFVQLPFSVLANMLRYKLAEAGITFVLTEESYTSKADFLSGDSIPVYNKEKAGTYTFSGKRIKRGLYRHSDGTITNADVNGSGNILRKVFPKVHRWDRGIVDMPCTVVRIPA